MKKGIKPAEPEPYFVWIDHECADIKCGCGEDMVISANHPSRCPTCQRVFQLQQRNWIEERKSSTLNICPWCQGVRYDDGSHCPSCTRNADGKTCKEITDEFYAARGHQCT